jgi:hypothetical protein
MDTSEMYKTIYGSWKCPFPSCGTVNLGNEIEAQRLTQQEIENHKKGGLHIPCKQCGEKTLVYPQFEKV